MNLTIEKTMARMTNATDSTRNYTVSGTVYNSNNGFEAVREGQVYTKDNVFLANFNNGVSEPLSISFATADITPQVQNAVIADIMSFIAAAKESAEA